MYHLVYHVFIKHTIQTRGRPKTFDETEALTAAIYCFWKHGYDHTSLDNFLLAMGIKTSSFYATFKSKEELFISFIQESQDKGEISKIKKAKTLAGRYMNTLNGLVVTIQAGASQELIDDLVENLKEILE